MSRLFHVCRRAALLVLFLAVPFLAAIAGFARPGAAEPGPLRILAFGDSLVHGYGLDQSETFPVRLETELRDRGHDVRVINAGNSGDTSAAGLARLDWALMDDPHMAIVEFGANDFLRGIDPRVTAANMEAIVARLTGAGIAVLLAGMRAPRNLGADYAAEFDAIYPRLAERYDVALYPFFLDGVALRPWLNQSDGIHPNGAGVAKIVEGIAPLVAEVLDGMPRAGGGDG